MADVKTARRPGTRAVQIGAAMVALAVLLSVLPGRLFDAAGPLGLLIGAVGAVVAVVGLVLRSVKRPRF